MLLCTHNTALYCQRNAPIKTKVYAELHHTVQSYIHAFLPIINPILVNHLMFLHILSWFYLTVFCTSSNLKNLWSNGLKTDCHLKNNCWINCAWDFLKRYFAFFMRIFFCLVLSWIDTNTVYLKRAIKNRENGSFLLFIITTWSQK